MTRSAQHTDARPIPWPILLGRPRPSRKLTLTLLANPEVLAPSVLARLMRFEPGPVQVLPIQPDLPLLDGRAE